jgi:hypothetical protein
MARMPGTQQEEEKERWKRKEREMQQCSDFPNHDWDFDVREDRNMTGEKWGYIFIRHASLKPGP